MEKIKWGILSTAKIGREKVIPAIQKSKFGEVVAIASRNEEQANLVARSLNIPNAFGSYEQLLADPQIDAIYNPLPNHLHVEWTIKAMQAGKHVLCEKPLGVSAMEVEKLLHATKDFPHIKVMEAFMYRFHPQWQYVKNLVDSGGIGELKTIQSFFCYNNLDENNIRNRKDAAGGGLLDIGCYCISWSRWMFNSEPDKVMGLISLDPNFETDCIASGILQFANGSATFTCSTQMVPFQRAIIFGSQGRIEIEIPVNGPPGSTPKVSVYKGQEMEEKIFDAIDQYTLQCDAFAQSIINDSMLPTDLSDAINNMKVIDAIFESGAKNVWVNL